MTNTQEKASPVPQADTKHSPLPWRVARPVYKCEREILAPVTSGSQLETVVAFLKGNPDGELDCDARLISASPDLLAAAESMVAASDGSYAQVAFAIGKLKLAIAKATGKEVV